MKKFIIILIIVIVAIYFFSGRYNIAMNNIKERGAIAILDEPLWLCRIVYEQWIKIKDTINNFIEGKTIGPQFEE